MEIRDLGNTGLTASAVGLGGTKLEKAADPAELLNAALEQGITLFDTARGYGAGEELIGRWLPAHRDSITLVTKVGYGIDGVQDWTGPAVTKGIENALRLLQTDRIDVALLHSCTLDVLQRGDVVEALNDAVRAGKIRAAGYSGENEELAWAVDSGRFTVIETSVNLVDQWSLHNVIPRAAAAGMGVIAKRPLANIAWRRNERPVGAYEEQYWLRLRTVATEWPQLLGDRSMVETAMRFATYAPGVSTAIPGPSKIHHLRELVSYADAGPLNQTKLDHWVKAWSAHSHWPGEI